MTLKTPGLKSFFLQANGIIKKLQGELRGLVGKIKVKNTVTVSQEKLLQETSDRLQNAEKELQSTRQQLLAKEEEVWHSLLAVRTSDLPLHQLFLAGFKAEGAAGGQHAEAEREQRGSEDQRER